MRISSKAAAVIVALVSGAAVLDARPGAIKIATIAPDNSAYVHALRQMADSSARRTGGRVRYIVYPAGDDTEQAILKNVRYHKLDAAQLSAITLGNIEPAFNVFGLPMFFESYAEADRVLEKLAPELERRLAEKDLKVLNLGYVGWVYVFSKKPVTKVDDLKQLKLYTSTGDEEMAKWYKKNGFRAVQLDSTVIASQLRTDMLDAVPAPPAFANILGWYQAVPYMMDIGFAPLMGATVMALDRWKQLPAGDQAIVLEEAQKAGAQLRKDVPRIEKEAIEAMQKRSLKVTKVDPREWRRMAEQLAQDMRNEKLVPGDIYDVAKRERDAARAGK